MRPPSLVYPPARAIAQAGRLNRRTLVTPRVNRLRRQRLRVSARFEPLEGQVRHRNQHSNQIPMQEAAPSQHETHRFTRFVTGAHGDFEAI
jgi:hypothetical protein